MAILGLKEKTSRMLRYCDMENKNLLYQNQSRDQNMEPYLNIKVFICKDYIECIFS